MIWSLPNQVSGAAHVSMGVIYLKKTLHKFETLPTSVCNSPKTQFVFRTGYTYYFLSHAHVKSHLPVFLFFLFLFKNI